MVIQTFWNPIQKCNGPLCFCRDRKFQSLCKCTGLMRKTQLVLMILKVITLCLDELANLNYNNDAPTFINWHTHYIAFDYYPCSNLFCFISNDLQTSCFSESLNLNNYVPKCTSFIRWNSIHIIMCISILVKWIWIFIFCYKNKLWAIAIFSAEITLIFGKQKFVISNKNAI